MSSYSNLIQSLLLKGWMQFLDYELRGYKIPNSYYKLKRYRLNEGFSYLINDVATMNNITITENIRVNNFTLFYEILFYGSDKKLPFIEWILEYKDDTYIKGGYASVQLSFYNRDKLLIYSNKRDIFINDDNRYEREYIYDERYEIFGQKLDLYSYNGSGAFDFNQFKKIIKFISPEIDFIHDFLYDVKRISSKIKNIGIDIKGSGDIISGIIEKEGNLTKSTKDFFNYIIKNGISTIGQSPFDKIIFENMLKNGNRDIQNNIGQKLSQYGESSQNLNIYQTNIYEKTKNSSYPEIISELVDYDSIYPFKDIDIYNEENIGLAVSDAYDIINSSNIFDILLMNNLSFYEANQQKEIIDFYDKITNDIIYTSYSDKLIAESTDSGFFETIIIAIMFLIPGRGRNQIVGSYSHSKDGREFLKKAITETRLFFKSIPRNIKYYYIPVLKKTIKGIYAKDKIDSLGPSGGKMITTIKFNDSLKIKEKAEKQRRLTAIEEGRFDSYQKYFNSYNYYSQYYYFILPGDRAVNKYNISKSILKKPEKIVIGLDKILSIIQYNHRSIKYLYLGNIMDFTLITSKPTKYDNFINESNIQINKEIDFTNETQIINLNAIIENTAKNIGDFIDTPLPDYFIDESTDRQTLIKRIILLKHKLMLVI